MHRRGFIGGIVAGIAGWFGIEQVRAEPANREVASKAVCYIPAVSGLEQDRVIDLLTRPNEDESFDDLIRRAVEQMYLTGTGLLWVVHNKFDIPFELYSIPTVTAFAYPAGEGYSQGHYRIVPMYPEGAIPPRLMSRQAVIPAEHVVRVMCPHPTLQYEGFSPLVALRKQADRLENLANYPFMIDRQFAQAAASKIADKLTKHLRPHFGDDLSITITAH